MLRKEYSNDFDFTTSFMWNIAGVRINWKWWFINKEKKLIVDTIYDEVWMFENWFCKVLLNKERFIINHYWETLSKWYYKIWEKNKENNNRIVSIIDEESLKDSYWIIKENWKEIVAPIYDKIIKTWNYFILKKKKEVDILVDEDWKKVIDKLLTEIITVTKNNNIIGFFDDYYWMINQRYEILIDFSYKEFLWIDNKTWLYVFKNDNKLYLFNQDWYFKQELMVNKKNNWKI